MTTVETREYWNYGIRKYFSKSETLIIFNNKIIFIIITLSDHPVPVYVENVGNKATLPARLARECGRVLQTLRTQQPGILKGLYFE